MDELKTEKKFIDLCLRGKKINIINPNQSDPDSLSHCAEEFLRMKITKQGDHRIKMVKDKLIHELEVHQIWLELQNQELIQSKEQSSLAEEKYLNLYDFAPLGYFTITPEGAILELNLTAAKLLGKDRSQLPNRLFHLHLTDDSKPVFMIFLEKVFSSHISESCELTLLSNSNTQKILHLTGAASKKGDTCFITAFDITECKLAEEKLKESEEKFRILFQDNSAVNLLIDPDNGNIVDANNAATELYGWPLEKLKTMQIWKIITLSPDELKKEIYSAKNKVKTHFEFKHRKADGSILDVAVNCVSVNINGKKYLNSIVQDIDDCKKAEKEAIKSREQYEQLYRRLNEIREEERTSISREIHDELGQMLAGLKIDLIVLKENCDDKFEHSFNNLISQVDTTISSVQKISQELRPQMLDKLGLASAIEWQGSEFKKRTGIKCKLEIENIEDLEGNIPISLFRIFQASLTNIMLHSKATSVSVKLAVINGILQLKVIDNGIGITQEQINSRRSLGIIGIRERAKQINGKLDIHTQKNKGTEIMVTVPLK